MPLWENLKSSQESLKGSSGKKEQCVFFIMMFDITIFKVKINDFKKKKLSKFMISKKNLNYRISLRLSWKRVSCWYVILFLYFPINLISMYDFPYEILR